MRIYFTLFLFCILGLVIPPKSTAQNNITPVPLYPPSPNTLNLGRYGEVPVGYYNGTASISIPFNSIQTASGFQVPIELNYNGSGVRVDDYPGTVGMSWSLNAGGMVSRTIQGGDDFGQYGYYHNQQPLPPYLLDDMCENQGEIYWNNVILFSNQGRTPYASDSRPDLFNFNFCGKSGKYIYRQDKMPAIFPFKNYQIYAHYQNMGNPATQQIYWIIIDEQNNRYEFTRMEINRLSTLPNGGVQDPYISGAYLTKIITAKNEIINFEYNDFEYTYQQGKSYYFSASPKCGHEGSSGVSTTQIQVKTPILKRITYNHFAVDFVYHTDAFSGSYQKILHQVVYTVNGQMQTGFKLDYDTDIQKQRAWLTKCTQLPNMATSENGPVYEFTYYNKDLLPARLHHSQDYWGYYNQNQYSLSLAPNIPNGLFANECATPGDLIDTRPNIIRNSDEELMKYGSLKRIQYPTGGYSEFEFEPHRFTNSYYSYYNINDEQIGAGLRVAQITNLSEDEKFLSQKKFEYVDGLIMSIPMPFFQSIASCGGTVVQMFNSSSSSLMQASPTASGSLVGYGKVIEYNLDENKQDNGKIERTFYNVQEEKPWEIVLGRRWTPTTPTQAFNWRTTGLFFPVGTPYNNENGTRNGSILTEEYFRNRDNHYEVNKRILYEYDTIGLGRVQGHIFAFPSCNSNTHWNCLEMVYIRYYTNTLYNRLINKKTFNYSIGKVDEYIDMPLINEENYLFGSGSFHLLTGTEKICGDMNLKTSFEYLPSLIAPQTNNDHYRLAIINNTSNYRNNLILDKMELNFNNDLLPIQMRKKIVSNSHQLLPPVNDDITDFTYNDNGLMKQAITSDNQKTAFIWDPVYEKITALILNGTEDDFVYAGFDNSNNHRVSYANSNELVTTDAKTGTGVYNLNSAPLSFELKPGKYRLSFWYKQNISQINISISAGNLLSYDNGTEDASGWFMYTALIEITANSNIEISGNQLMDELKVYPVEASLKTFTYSPNGMISNSNEANEISTFKYDAFGRLTLVGDNEGQVKTQVISRIKQ